MQVYLNDLMRNYPLETDVDSENIEHASQMLKGGNKNDIPNGGFLPIYLCDDKEDVRKEDIKPREFTKSSISVSIKDILEKRKKGI
jgi:hypothetical protein